MTQCAWLAEPLNNNRITYPIGHWGGSSQSSEVKKVKKNKNNPSELRMIHLQYTHPLCIYISNLHEALDFELV